MRAIIIVLSIFSILSAYKISKQEDTITKITTRYDSYVSDLQSENANLYYQLVSCKQLVQK